MRKKRRIRKGEERKGSGGFVSSFFNLYSLFWRKVKKGEGEGEDSPLSQKKVKQTIYANQKLIAKLRCCFTI